jgi:hypothetical protein
MKALLVGLAFIAATSTAVSGNGSGVIKNSVIAGNGSGVIKNSVIAGSGGGVIRNNGAPQAPTSPPPGVWKFNL